MRGGGAKSDQPPYLVKIKGNKSLLRCEAESGAQDPRFFIFLEKYLTELDSFPLF